MSCHGIGKVLDNILEYIIKLFYNLPFYYVSTMVLSILPNTLFPSVAGFVAGVVCSQAGSALHIVSDKEKQEAAYESHRAKVTAVVLNTLACGAFVGAAFTLVSGPVLGIISGVGTVLPSFVSKIVTVTLGSGHPVSKYTSKIDAAFELAHKVSIVVVAFFLAWPYFTALTLSGCLIGGALTLLPTASLVCDETVKSSLLMMQGKITAAFQHRMGW